MSHFGKRKRIRGRHWQAEIDVLIPVDGDERSECERIVLAMRQLGFEAFIDRTALATYCRAFGRWIEFERSRVRAT